MPYLTHECSGCFETIDGHIPCNSEGKPIYEYDKKARCYKGSGCKECGYTGKRRSYYKSCDCDKYDYCRVHGSPP